MGQHTIGGLIQIPMLRSLSMNAKLHVEQSDTIGIPYKSSFNLYTETLIEKIAIDSKSDLYRDHLVLGLPNMRYQHPSSYRYGTLHPALP